MKKLFALLLAALMVLSLAACGGNTTTDDTTAAPEETVAETAEVIEETAAPADETAAPVDETAAPVDETAAPADDAVAETAAETTAEAPAAAVPSTTAEIVALYNEACANVKTAKPGYTKVNKTALNNLEMGALAKLDAVRGAVGDFLGEGTDTDTVSKGKYEADDLVASKLTEGDVTEATCTLSDDGKYYDVAITVKNETNPLKKSSALGKFSEDYKDVNEIRDGLAEAGASLEGITVKSTKITIKAKIAVDGNKFESLEHSLNFSAVLSGIKYTIVKVKSATTDLNTNVSYSNFKY